MEKEEGAQGPQGPSGISGIELVNKRAVSTFELMQMLQMTEPSEEGFVEKRVNTFKGEDRERIKRKLLEVTGISIALK